MRYHPNHYAQALLGTLNDSPREGWDKLIKNLAELIAHNGDLSAADKIIAAVEKLWVRQNGGRLVEIETARPIDGGLADKMNPTPPLDKLGAGYRGGFSLQGVGSADNILKALHPRPKGRGITGGKIKKILAPSDHAEIKINPQLIAGIRITVDDVELDNSLAVKLNKIFA
ncbi:MAG: hypothetical protein HY454_02140 [Parcubacteria group bacterium]|nr:hypothetical protein [Parcubacteria group bacterium]